jgi:hypothetical protein
MCPVGIVADRPAGVRVVAVAVEVVALVVRAVDEVAGPVVHMVQLPLVLARQKLSKSRSYGLRPSGAHHGGFSLVPNSR